MISLSGCSSQRQAQLQELFRERVGVTGLLFGSSCGGSPSHTAGWPVHSGAVWAQGAHGPDRAWSPPCGPSPGGVKALRYMP